MDLASIDGIPSPDGRRGGPGLPDQIESRALREQGKVAEAETLVARLRDQFPDEAAVLHEYARIAETSRNWPEAGARWAEAAEPFPDAWEGLTGQARALLPQRRPDEARTLLLTAVRRFSTAPAPRHDLARLEEAERNWAEAEHWWHYETPQVTMSDAPPAWTEEAPAEVAAAQVAPAEGRWPTPEPVAQAPAKESSWLRRVFGSKPRK